MAHVKYTPGNKNSKQVSANRIIITQEGLICNNEIPHLEPLVKNGFLKKEIMKEPTKLPKVEAKVEPEVVEPKDSRELLIEEKKRKRKLKRKNKKENKE